MPRPPSPRRAGPLPLAAAAPDPHVAEKEVGALITEDLAKRLLLLRQAARAVGGTEPGPEGNLNKLFSSEHSQRVTSLGVRLAGTAEMSGWDGQLRPRRLQALWDMLALLPRLHASLDRNRATAWAGFRPMSADGLPFIGATPTRGLYLNTGHGHLGWTQSLGSGRLLADLICADQPLIDPTPYRVVRA